MGFLDNSGLTTLWSKIKALANSKAEKSQATKSITRSGTTYTGTRADNSTYTFTQQDNNTTYSAGTGIALSSTTFSLSAQAARNAMGLGNTTSYVPVANGGIGTNTLPKMIKAAGIRYGTFGLAIDAHTIDSTTYVHSYGHATTMITFGGTLPKVPYVFLNFQSSLSERPGPTTGGIVITTTTITATGFIVKATNGYFSKQTITVHWFAICL